MSEDLFSYSNSGEPKQIVTEFVEEVVTTLDWLAVQMERVPLPGKGESDMDESQNRGSDEKGQKDEYEMMLQKTVRDEKHKLWQSVISVTLNSVFGDGKEMRRSGHGNNAESAPNPQLLSVYHRMEVYEFFKRARATYGRTALCLSGGAMMGPSL
jgi:hypothetical protein